MGSKTVWSRWPCSRRRRARRPRRITGPRRITSRCPAARPRHRRRPAPGTEPFQALVDDAHARFAGVMDGKNADYIPILATIPSELFGVAIATRDGHVYTAGDVDYRFSIQSVSKPFTAALVMQQYGGPEIIAEKIGVEPTGLPFNSKLALEIYKARSVNPLVNAGAIAAVSLVQAKNEKERWQQGARQPRASFAGEKLPVLEKVYDSEYSTALGQPRHREPALQLGAPLLRAGRGAARLHPASARSASTRVDLALMGATLANGGVNPKTGKRMLDESSVPELLAIMMTAGLLRRVGPLGVRRRLAGEDRRRRRHRRGRPGPVRDRGVLAAPQRGRATACGRRRRSATSRANSGSGSSARTGNEEDGYATIAHRRPRRRSSCSCSRCRRPSPRSAEVEELKAQVRMLQQRLDQMEQREKERAAEPARAAAPPPAGTVTTGAAPAVHG